MYRKFLRSTCFELRRNSSDTISSIRLRSSGDLERAARKNPLYRASTCFCIPDSFGPLEAPIASFLNLLLDKLSGGTTEWQEEKFRSPFVPSYNNSLLDYGNIQQPSFLSLGWLVLGSKNKSRVLVNSNIHLPSYLVLLVWEFKAA